MNLPSLLQHTNLLLKEVWIFKIHVLIWKLDLQIKLLTFWLSELNSINLWPIAPIVLAVFLTWLRWSAIIVIFVHIGFRPIFFNGEFIIVVIWLNRQCYLVNHPALSSHPQKQALKYQDTMLFPAKWFHCITGGKAVELYIGSKFLVDEQFLIKFENISFANTDLRNM